MGIFVDILWCTHRIQHSIFLLKTFYSQAKFLIIANNYDIFMVFYLAFNCYGSSEVKTEIQC